MTDGRMYLSAEIPNGKARKVEVKITCSDGSEVVYKTLMKEISEAEEEISQKTHSTIKRMSEGSITIWLHTESSDAKEKMRHFIESGDISIFLENLFKTKGVRKLLTKDKYNIQIQIKEVDDATEGSESTTFQPMRKSDLKFKTCLDRCERFLLEELEPGSLIRDKEVGHIFSPIRADIEHWTNRTDRVKLLLEHLREKSEETIKLVMDRLKDKNRYVYDKLYPDVEKFQDVDIGQVKRNILDNLPELLGSMSVSSLQTPFLSAGIMSQDELDSLHENSESVRAENLKFVQMVLHRGDDAFRVFLLALEDSCGSDLSERLQNKTTIIYEREDERRNAKIEYEAFNEENGLLFQGNFLLELKSERTTGNVTRERLCAGNEEQQPSIENPSSEHPGNQSEESTSSDSDSNGTTPKDVPKNESRIKALEADTSTILSKLTRKLGKVEYVVDIRRILSTRDVGKRARMERVKRKYPRKFGAIEEEVLKLNTVLNELQILSRIFRDKVGFLTNWDDNEDNDDDDDDEDNDNDDDNDDDDDDLDDDDDEPQRIEDWSETVSSPETHLPFERQMSALVVRSTDEDSTMDSDEEEQEDINVLSRKSSKYQSILVGKFHQLETVKFVLDAFRHISDKETQLMAVKNILNEEQYKRLEKYIIKLQVISNKIKEVKGFAEVA